MALTKIGSIGINTGIKFAGVTTITTLNSATDTLTIGGPVSIAGTLTYEDVTNVDSIGVVTARDGIKVGSGITLSKDGDIFFTGIMTGNGSGLTGVANTDVIFTDKLSVGDSPELIAVGVGSDLQLLHSGGNSFIQNNTGYLGIQADTLYLQDKTDGHAYITCVNDGAVGLRYDNSEKLATSNTGVTVTGTVAATSYTGDGSSLTGIQAGIQTSVPKSVSGITTVLDLSKDDFKVTAAGITTIDVRGGSEGNSHTLRIHNSGITTVGFSTYFLFPSGSSPIIPTADGTISLISFTVDRQGAVGLATQLLAGSSVNFS